MRVGLFTESYDPVINGVSTSVKTLAAELSRAGHEPVVVAPAYPGIPIGVPSLPPFQDEPEAGAPMVRRLIAVRTVLNRNNPFVLAPAGQIARPLRNLCLLYTSKRLVGLGGCSVGFYMSRFSHTENRHINER